jgi:NADPH:quinone reductase-like Zn-dependent oxidoreductase
MAKAIGAKSIAVTRSEAKEEALLAVGADQVIIAGREDVQEAILDLTEGLGAEVIYFFGVGHRTGRCQGHVGKRIQRSVVRPTRSVRSFRLAVSMGRRAVRRSAFSGKQVTAAYASFATTAFSPLGDRFSSPALDFYHQRPRPGYSNMLVR